DLGIGGLYVKGRPLMPSLRIDERSDDLRSDIYSSKAPIERRRLGGSHAAILEARGRGRNHPAPIRAKTPAPTRNRDPGSGTPTRAASRLVRLFAPAVTVMISVSEKGPAPIGIELSAA